MMSMRNILFGLILSGLFVSAIGQASIGFNGIGVRLGYVSPSDIDGVIGFGAIVDLGTIMPNLNLQADLDYWSKSEGGTESSGTTTASASGSFSDFSIAANAKYMFPMSSAAFKPFVRGGLGIHFYTAEATATVENTPLIGDFSASASASSTKFGLDLGGGAEFAASPKVDVVGSVVYRLVSGVNQLYISAGAILNL